MHVSKYCQLNVAAGPRGCSTFQAYWSTYVRATLSANVPELIYCQSGELRR